MQSQTATSNKIPVRRRLLYVGIIYAVFLLLLLSVELVTRIALPRVNSLEMFVATSQQRMQVANEQQSGIFEGDPLLLWRLKPNLKNVYWDYTILSTNAQSFRADYPIGSKPPGTFRVVCLGDSVTFGYRVPPAWPERPTDYNPDWQPFPTLLEKELRKANPNRQIEVFPMAVPGYTSHQGLTWLRRDIEMLQPDLVIASFGWNDASMSDAPDRQAIDTRWFPVAIRWAIDHSQAFAHATRWLRSGSRPAQPAPTPVPRVSESEYVNNFASIVALVREHKGAIVVIGAPYRDSHTNPPEAKLMTSYRATLKSSLQQSQTPYLEILELTEAAGSVNLGFFGELIHPNHMGHRLMASELLKLMARQQLLGNLSIPEFVP
ncbi:MAG TPA: SGNH/GDSL hydrolase family protein [Pyrinomonadaceae bacterium]|nr:SGNH/GDSL hydrolase family protein [Pyrinomonadaceae bacterium]